MKIFKAMGIASLACLLAACGSAPEMPEQELEAKTELNTIAQQAYQQNQSWETLSPSQKDPYLAHYKDEAKAKASFEKAVEGMKYFFGGQGGVPQSAPGAAQGQQGAGPQ